MSAQGRVGAGLAPARRSEDQRLQWLLFLNFLWIFSAVTFWFYSKASAAVAEQDWSATRRLEALERENARNR